MASDTKKDIPLENFDDFFVGYPAEIEKNLKNLLSQAEALENKSIYLQILSQIALAQAMQKKFSIAHKTLDFAEQNLTPKQYLAKARILLERGRVFHQSGKIDLALPLFKRSYQICKKHKYYFHMINAAHMIAIVVKNTKEKINWNKKAIDLTIKAQAEKALAWLGALYNNLAQNYLATKDYKKAREAFTQSKKYGEKRGDIFIVAGAKWGIARSLRSLHLIDEALNIQTSLLEEYNHLHNTGVLPKEILMVARGPVYEELAEIYLAKSKVFAALAYDELSKDHWFVKLEPKRLKKMKRLKRIEI